MNRKVSKISTAALDYFIYGKRLSQTYYGLDRSQWWSLDKIKNYQWEEVSRMLWHTYKNVPYYYEIFKDAGLTPKDIKCPEDYLRIPILTKDKLRKNLGRMIHEKINRKKLRRDSTGGSTGEPTPYYQGYNYFTYFAASNYRTLAWTGWDFGDKIIELFGCSFDVRWNKYMKKRINNAFRNTHNILAFDMSKDAMSRYIREIKSFQPDLIIGYVEPLYLLACYLIEQGLQPNIRTRAVISTAGTLYNFQRETIESAFNCSVYNRYGSRELGSIAHECTENNGLHINAETVYLEVIRDGRLCESGEEGELVITSLVNFDMPFIRYAIGDRGILAETDRLCPCGRGLPLLERVTGRVQDIIVTPSGEIVAGEFFPHLFKEVDNVRQFQVVQKNTNELFIKVAPLDANRKIGIDFAQRKISKFLGEEINVVFQVVDAITPSVSGKLRPVVSHVPVNIAGYESVPV